MTIYDMDPFLSGPFAEEISYTPSGGQAKTIKAVVNRSPRRAMNVRSSDQNVGYYPIEIYISKTDIASVKVNEDSVSVSGVNGVVSDHRVRAIIAANPGGYKLGL